MKAKDILNNSAKKNMINWSEKDFKKSHPRLYKTIIEAINKALIIDSVVGQSEQLPNSHYRREVDETIRYAGTPSDDEFDEDHALDMVMNDMVKDLTEDTEESHSDHLYEEPNLSRIKESAEEWDEDHALDLVMNDMVKDLTEEDLKQKVGRSSLKHDPRFF